MVLMTNRLIIMIIITWTGPPKNSSDQPISIPCPELLLAEDKLFTKKNAELPYFRGSYWSNPPFSPVKSDLMGHCLPTRTCFAFKVGVHIPSCVIMEK